MNSDVSHHMPNGHTHYVPIELFLFAFRSTYRSLEFDSFQLRSLVSSSSQHQQQQQWANWRIWRNDLFAFVQCKCLIFGQPSPTKTTPWMSLCVAHILWQSNAQRHFLYENIWRRNQSNMTNIRWHIHVIITRNSFPSHSLRSNRIDWMNKNRFDAHFPVTHFHHFLIRK